MSAHSSFMDLNEAETFLRVVEAGGMSQAADLLGVPRSTVSRRIARLESDLGVQLLARTTRKMSLTEEGEAFFGRLQPALESAREAAAVVRDYAEAPKGHLRVSAMVDFSLAVLAPWIVEFSDAYPELKVSLDVDNRAVDLVGEGYDCAIRAGPMPDSTLVARKIADVQRGMFASPAYLAMHGQPTTVAHLSTHRFIHFRPDQFASRLQLLDSHGEAVNLELNGVIATDDYGMVHRMVLAGGGLGLMPSFVAEADVQAGRLIRILEGLSLPSGAIRFVTPAGRYQPAKVRAFREFLVEKLAPSA